MSAKSVGPRALFNWPEVLAQAKLEGVHAAELARRLNVSPVAIHAQCQRHEIELPQGRRGPNGIDWSAVLKAAAAAEEHVGAVAARTQRTVPAVYKYASAYGYQIKRGLFIRPQEPARSA